MTMHSLLQWMPISYLIILLAIFNHATSSEQEDYWSMKLPKVAMPQAIMDSLYHPSVEKPKEKVIKDVVEPFSSKKIASNTNQPYTVFAWKYGADNPQQKAEHVVKPLILSSNEKTTTRTNQPYTVFAWKYEANDIPQPKGEQVGEPLSLGLNEKTTSHTNQPYTVFAWKYEADDIPQQKGEQVGKPLSLGLDEKTTSHTNQPYTVFSWKYGADNPQQKAKHLLKPMIHSSNKKTTTRTNQPYTVFSWKYEADDIPQPKGEQVREPLSLGLDEKTTSHTNQPYTVFSWKYEADDIPQQKGEQLVEPLSIGLNEKTSSHTNQPYTVFSWKYEADDIPQQKGEQVGEPLSLGLNEKTTSHTNQPYTVFAWKYEASKSKIKAENEASSFSLKKKETSHHQFMHNNINSDQEDGGSVFFVEKSLRLGIKLKHDFQKTPKVTFLPKRIVQAIPFKMEKYTEILNLFSLDSESTKAKAIKETLGVCLQRPKVKKENRTCAQSMEDVVDFVVEELGTNNVKVRMMNNNIEVPNGIQDYILTKVKKLEIPGNNAVACHRMSYPYVVYYCHHQQDIGHYDVTLVDPSTGSAFQTTAICHYDTYAWQPNVPALRHLGIRPGDAPVCHFSAINDMFWSLKVDSKSLDMVQ